MQGLPATGLRPVDTMGANPEGQVSIAPNQEAESSNPGQLGEFCGDFAALGRAIVSIDKAPPRRNLKSEVQGVGGPDRVGEHENRGQVGPESELCSPRMSAQASCTGS